METSDGSRNHISQLTSRLFARRRTFAARVGPQWHVRPTEATGVIRFIKASAHC